MFGFRKKKKKKQEEELQARMHVIPDIFYGGNDPVIYHQKAKEQEKKAPKRSKKKPKKLHDPLIGPRARKWLIGVGVALFLGVSIAAAWYYIRQARISLPEQPEAPVAVEDDIPEIIEIEEEPIVEEETSTTTVEAEEPPPVVEEIETGIDPVSFPRILLIDAPDTDADELTDQEEVIFSTNVDEWDGDGDGYYDGQEVINLYNPSGFAPVKLIDSGLVSEYTNPIWQYRLYYPVSWQVGEVDIESRQVLISTLSGDFIEVRVFDRQSGQSFQDWFATAIEGESFQDLRISVNRFKESGWMRKDGLVAYFLSDTHVTVLIYHPGVTGAVPYRTVMRMMYQSFRPTKNTVTLPDQPPLPTPPSATPTAPTTSPTVVTSTP